MKICLGCGGARWVCQTHRNIPWIDGPLGCPCGAPGEPCPLCNKADPDTLPTMPAGFVSEEEQAFDLTGFDHHETRSIQDDLQRLIRQARRKH